MACDNLAHIIVMGFSYLIRLSEIGQIRRSYIQIENASKFGRIVLVIRQSKTDQEGLWATRALVETRSSLRTLQTMKDISDGWELAEDELLLWSHLRLRSDGRSKSIEMANGVRPMAIGGIRL